MLAEILELIKTKEEAFVFCGKRMICREIAISEDLGVPIKTEEDQERLEKELVYRLAVRTVFYDVGKTVDEHIVGSPVFTDDDIEKLRAGGKTTVLPLFMVVRRVNGLDGDADAKK